MIATDIPPSPVSSLVGIVTFLTEVLLQRGDPDVFVAAAQGPPGSAASGVTVGSGASLTWEGARGAAVGECLERYAASFVDRADPWLIGSHEMLLSRGHVAHPPETWALFDNAQNAPYPPFTSDVPIVWVEGFDLLTHGPVYLPASLVYLSASPRLNEAGAYTLGPAISTGCACATTQEAALLKGLYELIERDAFMIAWRNRLPIPKLVIDEASRLYPVYVRRFARPGLEYRLWLTTMDFSIPSVFGMLVDQRSSEPQVVVGGAASADAGVAVLKTLCELVQGLSWLDFLGSSQRQVPESAEQIRSFTDRAVYYATRPMPEAFSFLDESTDSVALSSLPSRQLDDGTMLPRVVAELHEHGFAPAGVDITTEDIRACGYVVMRVMVPGLETMEGDVRFQMLGGHRWRDVPVKLGYRDNPSGIADINPFPHPYP